MFGNFKNEPIDTSEIYRLATMLKQNNIPFDIESVFGGIHIAYPEFSTQDKACICSVILHKGSYGHEVGLLEIMGLLTKQERRFDQVVGFLTAQQVFTRIKNHWNSTKKD